VHISIIIPTLDEEAALKALLPVLISNSAAEQRLEIIVADAGSQDRTQAVAQHWQAFVIKCPSACRARQLNAGARAASGDVLYFLHADVQPPAKYDRLIAEAVAAGQTAGSFRLTFDWDHWFLRALAWFTRFRATAVRFGDQSLFVTPKLFWQTGGFDERLLVMEDQEMVRALKANSPFTVLPGPVTASSRKYQERGVFRQQGQYTLIYFLYYLGVSQARLKAMLRQSAFR
jgi:rSAM/selenodomain-associated transferase 2